MDEWDAARAAYDEYCRYLANAKDNHRYRGGGKPAWAFLSQPERDAWKAAVNAVMAHA